jgi:hypothetical protein
MSKPRSMQRIKIVEIGRGISIRMKAMKGPISGMM